MNPDQFTTMVAETTFELASEIDHAGMSEHLDLHGIEDARAYIRSVVVEMATELEKSKYAKDLATGGLKISWYDVTDAIADRLNKDCLSPINVDTLIEELNE